MRSALSPSLRQLNDDLPQMIAGVMSDNMDQQLECTTRFRKLLSKEKNPPIERVIACGVVPRFVEFLRSTHSMIQVRACLASARSPLLTRLHTLAV